MKCLDPTLAYLCGNKVAKDGLLSPRLVFSYDQALEYWKTPLGVEEHELAMPCGHCLLCARRKRKQMACRIANEASLTPNDNCFVTLTYDNDHLPTVGDVPRGTLVKKDLQDFIKRLRRRLDYHYGIRFRFFACGEYGSKTKRPHYHMVIFGWRPDFKQCEFRGNNSYVYDLFSDLWPFGFHLIQPFEVSHANYVAGYVTKKLADLDLPEGVQPVFFNSSRRGGGIGAPWFKLYGDHSVECGLINVKARDRIIHYAIPEYYYRLQRRLNPEKFQKEREKRILRCKSNTKIDDERLQYPMSLEKAIAISLEEYSRARSFELYSINKDNEKDKL